MDWVTSMKPGAATPAARTSRPSASDSIMVTTASTSVSESPAGVAMRSSATISPVSLTTAPAILVPPISMPIACTADDLILIRDGRTDRDPRHGCAPPSLGIDGPQGHLRDHRVPGGAQRLRIEWEELPHRCQ